MDQEIRFCRSKDGTRIGYTTYGQGEPALVFLPGWAITFQMEMQFRDGVDFYERLSEHRMVVRYDLRGIGTSTRDVEDLSVEAHVSDAEAVAGALGLEKYDVFGCAFDSPVALLYAHRSAQSVRRLVLWAPYARGDYAPRESTRAITELCRANWPLATRTLADIIGISSEDDRKRWARLLRDAISAENAVAYIESRYDINVTDIVGQVTQPALLLHRRGNAHIPVSVCRDLAAEMRNARFIELAGHAEPWIFGHVDYLARVLEFLDDSGKVKRRQVGSTGAIRVVLFSDLAGHTEMMSRLGDVAGREVLREHERITRDVLLEHDGTEIKSMGDGFMASFSSVTKAVECAIALQRAFDRREDERLSIRVGINAGEPIEEDDDLFGATVILASRIAAKAEGGEILVSDNVRSLSAGKGFLFADRGEFVAKGFEDSMRVYQVGWNAS